MQTFDDWFKARYGASFDELHHRPGVTFEASFMALSRALRDYTTAILEKVA